MTAPAPNAQGQLAQTPLLHLLVYALDRRLSGTLVLEDPNGKRHALYFLSGVPIKARAAEPVNRLGELLIALGLVDEGRIGEALEQGRAEHRLLGEVLVDTGALDAQALGAALAEQVWRTIEQLALLPRETAFGYYDEVNYLERWGAPEGAPVSPFSVIWKLVREHGSAAQVGSVLARLGDGALRLHVDSPISQFGFESRVQAVVDVLRAKPQPLAELLARDLTDGETVRRLIFTFALLRHLELPGAAQPIGLNVPAGSSTLAPPRVDPAWVT
ncbi:MAG TPA: DUF4388 domain-containing protein, partial [Polyangiaceae bacterium]|nr:DUF4388 domain-containing protein [Polyangiaceae bacterium]